jgi:hypothetical protein
MIVMIEREKDKRTVYFALFSCLLCSLFLDHSRMQSLFDVQKCLSLGKQTIDRCTIDYSISFSFLRVIMSKHNRWQRYENFESIFPEKKTTISQYAALHTIFSSLERQNVVHFQLCFSFLLLQTNIKQHLYYPSDT